MVYEFKADLSRTRVQLAGGSIPIQLYCRRHLGALAITDSQGLIDVGRLAHHLRTCPVCRRSQIHATKQEFACLLTCSIPVPRGGLKYSIPPPLPPLSVADQGSPEYSPDLKQGRAPKCPQNPRSSPAPHQGPNTLLTFEPTIPPSPGIHISLSLSDRIYLRFCR